MRRLRSGCRTLLVGTMVIGLAGIAPPAAPSSGAVPPQRNVAFQGEEGMPADDDARRGSVAPSRAARQIVR